MKPEDVKGFYIKRPYICLTGTAVSYPKANDIDFVVFGSLRGEIPTLVMNYIKGIIPKIPLHFLSAYPYQSLMSSYRKLYDLMLIPIHCNRESSFNLVKGERRGLAPFLPKLREEFDVPDILSLTTKPFRIGTYVWLKDNIFHVKKCGFEFFVPIRQRILRQLELPHRKMVEVINGFPKEKARSIGKPVLSMYLVPSKDRSLVKM